MSFPSHSLHKKSYTTLSQAHTALLEKGFTHNFRAENEHLKDEDGKLIAPQDLTVVSFFKFEGMTNPADTTIIYALAHDNGMMGTFIDGFGAYATGDIAAKFKSR